MTAENKKITPKAVPRDEFKRILGNLVNSAPISRKDAKLGHKKTTGTIIPPTQKRER